MQNNLSRKLLPLLCILMASWLALQWFYSRPPQAAADWMGWRQADTQAIALNFRDSGNDILHPQIDWRGAGPGYVETEFQLFTYLIKLLLPAEGNAEWPGQAISLLAMAIAMGLLYRVLDKTYGPQSAFIATLAAMANAGTLRLATAIQPDALCFLFYTAQLVFFLRYINEDRADESGQHWLWLATLFAILAVLIKTTALHLGIIQFVALALGARNKLTSIKPWLSWAAILLGLGVYIAIIHQHYVQYGNTFGIGFGGDAKWPALRDLINPLNYYTLLRQSMTWGIGIGGFIAAIALLLRRKLTAWEWALIAGNAAHLVVSMRYSSTAWLASHYHIFGVFLGSWLIAHAWHEFAPRAERRQHAVFITLVLLLGAQLAVANYKRVHHDGIEDGERFLALAQITKPHVSPGTLIVVRSTATSFIEGWRGGVNNFEDPRLLYLTRTKGWVLATDDDDTDKLVRAISGGARFYVHMGGFAELPQTQAWLAAHAQRVAQNRYGALYRLPAASGAAASEK